MSKLNKSPQRLGARKESNQITLSIGQTITERPILFQTEMVKAILEGRKTQTRRKIDTIFSDICEKDNGQKWPWWSDEYGYDVWMPCKYGKPGDLLWVRESFRFCQPYGPESLNWYYKTKEKGESVPERFHYESEYERWRPSIHMPKDAARIWLMIEDIQVERVQEISEEDAMDEGVEFWNNPLFNEVRFKDYQNPNSEWRNANTSFASLWISINGEESWNANPWVWVVKFRVLSTTGKPSEEIIQKNLSDLCASAVNERKEASNG